MASPSSSSSRPFGGWSHDVFLSFRGEDTRKTFVGHLYSALSNKGIHTYKDDETLPRGKSIGPSLEKAIEESRIAVVVFSRNYASSGWCLDELAKIMKCKEERGQIVMPVFFDVEPSDVKNQKRKFGEAFRKKQEAVGARAELWRKALVDAATISGWELKNIDHGNESKCIEEIVKAISSNLHPTRSRVSEDLVGMKIRMKDFIPLLKMESYDVHMVGIWGIGGGGKTTLAYSVYQEVSHQFESCIFVGDVREESNKSGLKKLQEQILSKLLKMKTEVGSVEEGKSMMETRLSNKNVLIVLDDVDDDKQLKTLVGFKSWFGARSRIIITTRNEHVLNAHKVDEKYKVNLLKEEEAIKLFHRHAFVPHAPTDEFKNLSLNVVSYACGLPLALIILGSFLCDKNKNEWMDALNRLKCTPDDKIVATLKISYDGLQKMEKEIFLDIACFYTGRSVKWAKKRLDACGFHSDIGIKVLVQKSLVTIVEEGFGRLWESLEMHDLVREFGQHIVQREDHHSRIWKLKDFQMICSEDSSTVNDTIKALFIHCRSPPFNVEVFPNIKKLRLLDVDTDAWLSEPPLYLSNELRWISWTYYPISSQLPENFAAQNLSVLELKYSRLTQLWTGDKILPCLKELNLAYSQSLVSTPNFEGLPLLKKLDLSGCSSLTVIHPSIGYHEEVVEVNLSGCSKLEKFPPIIQMKSLKVLNIGLCRKSLVNHGFESHSLEELNLRGCGLEDKDIPSLFGGLPNLKVLHLSGNYFSRLQSSLSLLSRLKYLDLSDCKRLVEFPDLPSGIAFLDADSCRSLEVITDLPTKYKCLWYASFQNCPKLHTNKQNIGAAKVFTILQGHAIENDHYFFLAGDKISRELVPSVVEANNFTLRLPRNWYYNFCGFSFSEVSFACRMHYIPFSSLKHTTWWNSACNLSSLSFKWDYRFLNCGFRLVRRKNKTTSNRTQTTKLEFFDELLDRANYKQILSLFGTGVLTDVKDCVIDSKAGVKMSFLGQDLYLQ